MFVLDSKDTIMEKNDKTLLYWVHQGHNLRKWRDDYGIEIDTFAQQMDMEVKDIAQLEMSQFLPDKLLKKIVARFHVSLDMLKETKELLPSSYTSTTYMTFTGNGSVSGVNIFNGLGWTNTTIHNSPTIHPLDKVCELYERMLKWQNDKIQILEKELAKIKKELISLRKS